jgi:hypothetical protein
MKMNLFARCPVAALCVVCVTAIGDGCGGGESSGTPDASDTGGAGSSAGGSPGTAGANGTAGSGGSTGGVSIDGSTGDAASCTPRLPEQWNSKWAPPRAPMIGACTSTQLADLYDKCEFDSPLYDALLCRAFEVDMANAACAGCMYSVEGDAAWGPVVLLKDRAKYTNIGGCIALVDGDKSDTSCGAKYWARVFCDAAACDYCPRGTYTPCVVAVQASVCSTYYQDTVCAERPQYAECRGLGTYKNYFLSIGAIFCSTGLDVSASDAAPDVADATVD